MNDDPLDPLWRHARGHRAPPELWSRIAVQLQRPARPHRWHLVAAMLLGGCGYFAAAQLMRAGVERGAADALTPIVAASWPYLAQGGSAAPFAEQLLLQHLAAEPKARSR